MAFDTCRSRSYLAQWLKLMKVGFPRGFRCRRQGVRKTRRKDIHFAAAPAIASSRTPEGTALELLQWFWQRGLQCRRLSP